MRKISVDYRYVRLEKAAELLGVSAIELIHAGAHDQIQICANIYGRTRGRTSWDRIPAPDELDPADADQTELQDFHFWHGRCSSPMPAGIYEVGLDALRFLEMPETKEFQLHEGYKRDASGWHLVEFGSSVTIDRGDLVILSGEIERITSAGGFDTQPVGRPLSTRERDTLLAIIAVLCKEAGYDASKHAKTAGLIKDAAAAIGVSIGETTIEGHLKKIPDALGTRMK